MLDSVGIPLRIQDKGLVFYFHAILHRGFPKLAFLTSMKATEGLVKIHDLLGPAKENGLWSTTSRRFVTTVIIETWEFVYSRDI